MKTSRRRTKWTDAKAKYLLGSLKRNYDRRMWEVEGGWFYLGRQPDGWFWSSGIAGARGFKTRTAAIYDLATYWRPTAAEWKYIHRFGVSYV